MMAQDLYLVGLGTGEPEFEEFFRRMAAAHPGRIGVRIGFDNGLAHRIEAGPTCSSCPAAYEPCGLQPDLQPAVRHGAGGSRRRRLDDTIDEDTGFKFAEYSGPALAEAVRCACRRFPSRTPGRP